MKIISFFFALSDSFVLTVSKTEPGECLADCSKTLARAYYKCIREWGIDNDDFYRCFDNSVEDFVICRDGCIAGIFPKD
ncbi:unnamed protein product [Oikopleura dioica]|uniref:Uncharacterized protein n=1 Tax=Oikopleura dioica TaxID=34765 RepID=E4YGC5_OIKDI|nr:unnamed protein product [Oikopleura dioica]